MTKEERLKYYGKKPLLTLDHSMLEEAFINDTPGYIEEGLIKTYPIDRVLNMMAKLFDLEIVEGKTFSEIRGKVDNLLSNKKDVNGIICKIPRKMNKVTTGLESINIFVGDGEYNRDLISQHMEKYGYFLANWQYYDTDTLMLAYEKKFDCDVTDIVKRQKYIYHICPTTLMNKIKLQGLTPHTSDKWSKFSHSPRCYFFVKLDIETIKYWAEDFRKAKEQDSDYMLLAINTSKLNDSIKFYADPRMEDGIYTYEGISPAAIEIINTKL